MNREVGAAIREQVTPTAVDTLADITDPYERAQAALDATEAAAELRAAVAAVRSRAVLEMSEAGETWPAIARRLGTSVPRAYQIAHGKNR